MLTNRREFERFALPFAYTPVAVRLLDEQDFTRDGHGYNLSEGGLMLELDRPIAPGTPVAVRLELPGFATDGGPGRAIFAIGTMIWAREEDLHEGGPVRMALAFRRFVRAGDRERLLRQLASGRYARAA